MLLEDDVNNSQSSNSSITYLPSKYHSNKENNFYHFKICLNSYQNLQTILQNSTTFWFSWSFLDVAIQTAIFDINKLEVSEEYITIRASDTSLLHFLSDLPSIKLFLCIPNKILSYVEILIPKIQKLPFQYSKWLPIIPLENITSISKLTPGQEPIVHIIFEVARYNREEKNISQIISSNNHNNNNLVEVHESLTDDENGNDNEYDDEKYDEDDENEDGQNNNNKVDNNNNNNKVDNNNNNTNSNNKEIKTQENNSNQSSNISKINEEDEEIDSVYDTQKYRLSIQIRSIRGLKRAGHVHLQFAYPYLGVSSSPIRTHGTWCLPNSETLIENAAASYEFQMISSQLVAILKQNNLIVNVFSRTQLGTEPIGDSSIDLNSLNTNRSTIVLYRCPLTGKQFKSMDQYKRHRQTMIALYTLGRLNEVPSKYPIIIRSIDILVPILEKLKNQSTEYTTEIIGKLRAIVILEHLGKVGHSNFSQPNLNNLNILNKIDNSSIPIPPPPPPPPVLPPTIEEEEVLRRLEWEEWRRKEEEKWMNSLREKEVKLRKKLEEEMASNLAQKADDLKRAQEEVGRLEVRLRTSIETIEKQKLQLQFKEEQMNIRLAQKTEELSLLQKKIREEAKSKIEQEIRKNVAYESQINILQETLKRTETRAQEAEKDYETYRQYVRSIPETQLREELSKYKAMVNELRGEIEKEKRLKSEVELEKEHYRSQMHRIAIALKREREKSSVMARQELEQLRLEFLAREERYILDGDRDELRTIREELSQLRMMNGISKSNDYQRNIMSNIQLPIQSYSSSNNVNYNHQIQQQQQQQQQSNSTKSFMTSVPSPLSNLLESNQDQINKLKLLKKNLLESGLYEPTDSVIQEIEQNIYKQQISLTQQIDGTYEEK